MSQDKNMEIEKDKGKNVKIQAKVKRDIRGGGGVYLGKRASIQYNRFPS